MFRALIAIVAAGLLSASLVVTGACAQDTMVVEVPPDSTVILLVKGKKPPCWPDCRDTVPPPDSTPPDTVTPPPPPFAWCPETGRQVPVANAQALASALASPPRPGDVIRLAAGTYNGKFKPRGQGTEAQRITLCGPPDAILTNAASDGYTLGPDGIRWWVFRGFTIDKGLKGIMADRSHDNLFDSITVKNIAGECVHLRNGSSRNELRRSHIHHCGVSSQYGEGVYVGSSPNNVTNDQASGNRIIGNLIEMTAADGVNLKGSTRQTLVAKNVIRKTGTGGCKLPSDGSAPSCAGSNSSAPITERFGTSTIECNLITPAPMFGRRMVAIYAGGVAGDGENNAIRWNHTGVETFVGSVSIASGKSGNTVTENTPQGYATHCGA